jgi:hypothetical protein
VNAAAAKQALSDARDSLAQLASMPEAARLQGDTRTQISQLISNFNELITTQSNWKEAYAKVETDLNALIGPEGSSPEAAGAMAGTAGTTGAGSTAATGTAGSTTANPANPAASASAASAPLDPAIRAKLVDFRTHLKAFEKAAGGEAATSATPTSPSAAEPSAASTPEPASASNPASASPATPPTSTPTTSPSPTSQSAASTTAATQGAVATSGTSEPTATDARSAEVQTQVNRELDAIQAILAQARNGRLEKAQITELNTHVAQLRQLIGQSK